MKSPENPGISRALYVYELLLAAIRNGELHAGERLRETDIADRLRVSRTPVREAIRRLASDGLVTVAPSGGVQVLQLDRQQVKEIYALRATLEGASARLAAQHASANEVRAMKELLDRYNPRNSTMTPQDIAKINHVFHQAIHDTAQNRYLSKALMQLSDFLALLPGTTFQIETRRTEAWREHRAILRAIEQREPAKAEELARQHIENAEVARLGMMFTS
jgi:DNA-binding GntR family transcriptional regulator